MNDTPDELSDAVYSLHGTLTRPNEMVAFPMDRGGMGLV